MTAAAPQGAAAAWPCYGPARRRPSPVERKCLHAAPHDRVPLPAAGSGLGCRPATAAADVPTLLFHVDANHGLQAVTATVRP